MIKLLVCLLLLSGCAARSRTIVIMPNPYIETQERQVKIMELAAQEERLTAQEERLTAQEERLTAQEEQLTAQIKIIAEKTASEKRKE